MTNSWNTGDKILYTRSYISTVEEISLLKKILAIAILIMFIGIYNVPNGTCIQTKKDIISSAEPTLNDNWIYSDGIAQDTSHSFNKRTPQHRYQRTIYDNKQFFPKFQDILTVQDSRKSSTNGKILYVGGSGAGNYTSIKSAIIYTQDGDTIFVYDDSSPYYERGIYVDKSIHIIGENKETTIIDGKQLWGRRIIGISSFGFTIIPDGVTISGFTLQNFGDPVFNPFNDGGIMISSNNNVITNNIIINSCFGIFLSGSYNPAKNNTISGNILDSNSDCGVYIQQSDDNEISMNVFRNNGQYGGLVLDQLKNNNISGNKFFNDGVSI